MGNLEGKVVIVTGGGGGIGRESAHVLAAAGAQLVIADISEEAAGVTVDQLRERGFDAVRVGVDVGAEQSVKAMVGYAVATYGRLDGAFNNAAIEQKSKLITELELSEWDEAMRVDLTGVFLCLKHQIPAMLASGGGSIVNTSSAAAHVVFPGAAEYVAAKAGVLGLTRAAALDFGDQGIRVNSILPGIIATPMIERLEQLPGNAEYFDSSRKRHVLKRFGKPAEIGRVAQWLLSDDSSFVQGAEIFADGGISVNGS